MKPTNKTPYEIRLELLQLAFQVLSAKHQAIGVTHHTGKAATSPTTEEVMAEAEKMNAFISKVNHQQHS
jgi:hypothetical protein